MVPRRSGHLGCPRDARRRYGMWLSGRRSYCSIAMSAVLAPLIVDSTPMHDLARVTEMLSMARRFIPPAVRGLAHCVAARLVHPQERSEARSGWRVLVCFEGRRGLRDTSWLGLLAAAAIFAIVALLLFSKAWLRPTTTLAAGSDNAAFTWYLAWDWYAVTHWQSPLTTDRIAYPSGANMMWNNSMLAAGIVFGPVTAVFGPAVTFLVIETFALIMCGFTTFVLARFWGAGWLAAATAGLFFEISPFAYIHAYDAHINLTLGAGLLPLLVLQVSRLVQGVGRWIPTALSLAACLVVEFFTSEEFIADAALVFAIGLLLATLVFHEYVGKKWRPFVRGSVLSVIVFAATVAVPLWVQLVGPNQLVGRDIQADFGGASRYSLDLANLVVPTWLERLAPQALVRISSNFVGTPAEQVGYLGLPLVGTLIASGVVFWKDKWVRWILLTTVTVTALAMGPWLYVDGSIVAGPLPMSIIERAPLLENVIPVRLMVFVFLAAALMLGRVVDNALKRLAEGSLIKGMAGFVASAACMLTVIPISRVPATTELVPSYLLRDVPENAVVAIFPFPTPAFATPEYWSAASGVRFKMLGGYVIVPDPERANRALFGPRSVSQEYWNAVVASAKTGTAVDSSLVRREREELRALDVDYVVLGEVNSGIEPEAEREITRLLRVPGRYEGGVWVWKISRGASGSA